MTTQLAPRPLFRDWDNNGNPLAGGQLFSYVAGTSNPQATWTDSTQSQVNTNPVLLNSRGEAAVWLDPTLTYKLVLQDTFGNQIWTADNIVGGYLPITQIATYITQSYIGQTLFSRSAREIAANVTPTNFAYPQGDPRRYGAVLDGVTDDTAALNVWATVAGNLTFPSLTALVSGPITLFSNTTITASRGAAIVMGVQSVSILQATSQSQITISGLKLSYSSPASQAPVTHWAGVYLNTCTNCYVLNCEFAAMEYGGVWLDGSSNCVVRDSYFHDGTGGAFGNSHDILVYTSSNGATAKYNLVEGNLCFGGQVVGIMIQDGTGTLGSPSDNQVIGNFVKNQTGYGIIVYMTAAAPDTNNKIVGNHVENIIGSFIDVGPSTQNFGAGIYIQGAGGTIVANNTVQNCCQQTNSTSLAPAAIGVSNIGSAQSPVVVVGNNIKGMTQYWGILYTGVLGGGTITGNTVVQPPTNTTGDCIKIANSLSISVEGNTLVNLNTTTNQMCIAIWAQGASCNLIDISGNTCTGGFQQQIRTIQTGGNTVAGLTIRGNHCTGGQSGCVPLTFDSGAAVNVLVSANNLRGGSSAAAIKLVAGSSISMVDNLVVGNGPAILDFSGASTSCFYSHSNVGQGSGAGISNAGTGVVIETLGTAVPAAGTWARGDTVKNSSPTAAGVLFWVCTTAGTGGGTAVFKTVSNT